MKLLFEHKKATLHFNEETNAIELSWKKIQDEETYKLMFSKGVEFLTEYKATKWLSDIRKQGVVGPQSSKWLQEVIIPKAVSLGLRKVAIVTDPDVFKKLYVDNLKKGSTQSEFMKHFDSIDSANAWLKE